MHNPLTYPANSMKQKMAVGELAVGIVIRMVRGVEIAAVARSAGFDCLYIDLEHCPFSMETVSQISLSAVALGVTPMVRVPGHDQSEIGRCLEAGAQGVIVPHVDTPEQARSIVEAARFAPLGNRSLLATNAHTLFRGGPAAEVMAHINEATVVVVMIESQEGLARVEEIAAVEGVDMLLVGANDLCNSLGCPGQLDHPAIREAYEQVAAACRKFGKYLGVGGLNSRPELAKQMIALGAGYVSAGSDTGFLMGAGTAAAASFR